MEITREQIKHLATLSRLEFDDAELDEFIPEFQAIVDYVNQLQLVDTSLATDKSVKIKIGDLRDDIPQKSLSNDEVVGNATHKEEGAFIVPTVVE